MNVLGIVPLHNNLEKGGNESKWVGWSKNHTETGGFRSQEDFLRPPERQRIVIESGLMVLQAADYKS